MANVILFGPPGIGKSTLIGHLKTAGNCAIDLEDMYPNRLRFQVPNAVKDCYIGAADLNPKRKYPGCLKVLLTMPQKEYEARRRIRDSAIPGKSQQAQHLVADWESGVDWDLVLDASSSPAKLVQTLTRFRKEAKK